MRMSNPLQSRRKEPVLSVPWDADDTNDIPPTNAIRRWLAKFSHPDQLIAVWVKGHGGRNSGGFYKSSELSQLVRDVAQWSGNAIGVHWSINPVDHKLLDRADHRLCSGLGPPKDCDVLQRRFLPIDIDPKRPTDASATDLEKQRAYDTAMQVRSHLTKLGWPEPAMIDSGNGFYLLYRIDLPTDDAGLVKGVLRYLSKHFSNDHVEIDTSVANPGRVLKIPGTMACKGSNTAERPYRISRVLKMPTGDLSIVPLGCLQAIASHSILAPTNRRKHTDETVPPRVVEQARRYVTKMPSAISGQRGHNALLLVASRIVVGFNIPATSDSALQLMLEFNERCAPPWSDDDLRRKLKEADRLAVEQGADRGDLRNHPGDEVDAGFEPLPGNTFPVAIPDFALLPADIVLAPVTEWKNATPTMALGTYLVMTSLRTDVRIPDTLVRDIYWGSRPPQAWRRSLRSLHEDYKFKSQCYDDCPFSGTDVRHKHLIRPSEVEIKCLEPFVDGTQSIEEQSAIVHRSYSLLDKEKLSRLQKQGFVYYAYLPAFLFARSKALGLTPQQARCLLGITGELTRVAKQYDGESDTGGKRFVRGRSLRVDRAEVIVGGYVLPSGNDSHRVLCPMLDREKKYVVFGGNLANRRGRGYSILRVRKRSWQELVGFEGREFESGPYDRIKSFFDDLEVLSDVFELTVVGRHHSRGEWKSLREMKGCLETGVGRDWLDEATLRIFAPEDYLIRWRYAIAKRLGFSWIPGADCPFTSQEQDHDDGIVRDAPSLNRFLKRQGWTHALIADKLGVRRETVSRHLSGGRNSPEFWRRAGRLSAKYSVSAKDV